MTTGTAATYEDNSTTEKTIEKVRKRFESCSNAYEYGLGLSISLNTYLHDVGDLLDLLEDQNA